MKGNENKCIKKWQIFAKLYVKQKSVHFLMFPGNTCFFLRVWICSCFLFFFQRLSINHLLSVLRPAVSLSCTSTLPPLSSVILWTFLCSAAETVRLMVIEVLKWPERCRAQCCRSYFLSPGLPEEQLYSVLFQVFTHRHTHTHTFVLWSV